MFHPQKMRQSCISCTLLCLYTLTGRLPTLHSHWYVGHWCLCLMCHYVRLEVWKSLRCVNIIRSQYMPYALKFSVIANLHTIFMDFISQMLGMNQHDWPLSMRKTSWLTATLWCVIHICTVMYWTLLVIKAIMEQAGGIQHPFSYDYATIAQILNYSQMAF